MDNDFRLAIEQLADYLLPELTPYESALYFYLFRNSFVRNGTTEIRTGKRTIAAGFSKGSRGEHTSYAHVSVVISNLEKKGCVKIGDINRFGTLYKVVLPKDIPLIAEIIARKVPVAEEEDYFKILINEKRFLKEISGFASIVGKK